MIIDSSVLIAILKNEPDCVAYENTMTESRAPLVMSAATYLEAGIVADKFRDESLKVDLLDRLIATLQIAVTPVTETQARFARLAYRRYGKGSGHAAQLNFGDCFAYALAKDRDEPLLFKGNDFSQTDLMPALA